MKLVIVGHGPSLEGAGLGAAIDACDAVIRFKKGWKMCVDNPADYGAKCDYVLASTEVPGTFLMPDELKAKVKAFIAYPKYGFFNELAIESMEKALQRTIAVPLNIFNYWNYRFRSLGAAHPNVSAGMAGIIIGAHELRPESMRLAGMDALLHPDGGFKRIETVPRTGAGEFPKHDWHKENELLNVLAKEYGFTFENINDSYQCDLQRSGRTEGAAVVAESELS
jgi:hypothetical protein